MPKFSLSKPNFLAIDTRIEVHALNWLTAFFVFAATVVLLSQYLSGFIRQYGFQIFLGLAILWMLIRTRWRPLLTMNGKVGLFLLILVLSYFGGLFVIDQLMAILGYQGSPSIGRSRSDILLLAVLAPILEELFFRDLILRSLFHRLKNFWAALVISSLLFMVAHLTLYPGALLLGFVCSILVLSCGSLWPAMVFHALSNLSLLFLPAWYPNLWEALQRWGLITQFYR